MKFLSIVLLSCLAFSNVHAASEFPTNFEELGEMFDQGTLPTEEETFGWWSGRCYTAKAPSEPVAGLLTSRINIHPDNGGDFPPKTAHQMMFHRPTTKAPANSFDNDLSRFKGNVTQRIRDRGNQKFITEEKEGSLATDGSVIFSLRKYRDYFVGQSSHYLRGVYANCYFFKKVY